MTFHNIKWTTHPTRALLVCMTSGRSLSCRTRNALRPSALEKNWMMLLESWESAELPVAFFEHCPMRAPATCCDRRPLSNLSRSFEAFAAEATCEWKPEIQDFANPRVRPRPGDLVFESKIPSLFRNSRFNRFFEDLGGPLLIIVGDDLEGPVLETGVDSLLSGYPIIVVTDAAPLGATAMDGASLHRANSVSILSCFARLMKTDQLLNEWAII
jgi:hypothetical protein